MDEAEALAALEGSSPDPDAAAQPEVTQAPTNAPTEATESFTQVDPNTLPPELQSVYKSMLADYTRKTQEVAPWRKSFEGVDASPEDVAAAYEFYNRLNSDVDYAKDIYGQLGEALSQFMDNPNVLPTPEPGDEIDPVDAKLSALEQKIQQFEELQRFNAGAAELQRQEMALRSQHEKWDDDDFTAVYELAQAYDGNLIEAGKAYDALQSRIVGRYLNEKAGVNPALAPVTTGREGQEPTGPPKDTQEAHVRALEYLQQQLAAEGG